ncbi:MAG: response regulator [Pedosphaera sp.]|nr:response regulator [Pedosphaera sp.]
MEALEPADGGAMWLATHTGVARFRPRKLDLKAPRLSVQMDTNYTDLSQLPSITAGRLITFKFSTIDYRTRPESQQYRWAMLPGDVPDAPAKADVSKWREPKRETQFACPAASPGRWPFFVQAIDRDLNYSAPTRVVLEVVPPWFANAFIVVPGGGAALGLVGWAFVARSLVIRRKCETEQLKERLLEEEGKGRETAERARLAAEKAKEAAESANAAKSEFLANMSHEIRTQMAASKERNYVDAITSSGRTLLTLINDILDLSKIEAGKLELQNEPMSVARLVDEIQKLFSIKAGEKGIQLLTEIDPKLPRRLMLDEVRLRQVLFNVVGNALKFTEKGHVKLRAWALQTKRDETRIDLILEVSDTGIGIPKSQQDHVFGAFSQVAGQSTRKFGGTGLGLAITKRLTDLMRGTVAIESETGQGSTFRFTFPDVAVTDLAESDASAADSQSDFAQFAPATILVADDVALNRALLKGYFDGTPHQVITVTNGLEAIEEAKRSRPDIILMDMRMPELDGHAATRRLKANPDLKHIPVIAVTASSFREEEAKARKICDGFIRKPFNRAELIAELHKFLKPAASLPRQPVPEEAPVPVSAAEAAVPVPAAVLARRPALMAELRGQQQTVWPRLCKTKSVGEIEAFAQRLLGWAEEGHWPSLRSYAEMLEQQAQEFDFSRLPQTLVRFPEVIASLS